MKKIALTALSLVTALSLLAGCGKTSEPAKPDAASGTGKAEAPKDDAKIKGKLTVLTNRTDLVDKGEMKKYADRFKQKYPGIEEVKFEGLTNYESDIRVRLTTGEAGDVLLIPSNIANKDLGNFFEPLDDIGLFKDAYFADFKANDGKRYGIVSGVSTEGIVYNKKAFAEAGIATPPKTLDEFYAAAEKLKAKGIVPIYINYGAQWPMKQWAEVLAPAIAGDAQVLNKMTATDEPFTPDAPIGKALSIARTLIERGYVEKDLATNNWEASKVEVAQGRAAMYYLGNWVINQIIGAGAKAEDIGFFPMPTDNSGKINVSLNPDWFYAVSKTSKNKDAAKAWVKFMVEESGYDDASGFIPTLKTKQPQLPQLTEFMSTNPNKIENVPNTDQFNDIANKAQIDFFGGKYVQKVVVAKDFKAALDELNKKWKDARKAVIK